MKQIYEIPEVTIYNVSVHHQVMATSNIGFGSAGDGSDEAVNSNSMDDQSTPWYRQ